MASSRKSKRFSAIQHEDLNSTVNGFLANSRSVTDIVQALDRSKDVVGKKNGITPGSVDHAVELVKDVLTFRLQEAATGTLLCGTRKGTPADVVSNYEKHLKNVEESGYVVENADLLDFNTLLQNLQGKLLGQSGQVIDKVPWLLNELTRVEQQRSSRKDPVRLSDATLAVLVQALLREMRRDPKAAEKVARAQGITVIKKILLGDVDAAVEPSPPYHPELQAYLAQVLSELILFGDREVSATRLTRSTALGFYQEEQNARVFNKRMASLAQQTQHNAETREAMETLFFALDGAVGRHEHALVWGVLSALDPLVKSRSCCQQMLMTGFVPLLHRLAERYGEHPDQLPAALERPHNRHKRFSKMPPEFPFHEAQHSALIKPSETVKDSWLRSSDSLPELYRMSPNPNPEGFAARRGFAPAPLDGLTPTTSKVTALMEDLHRDPNSAQDSIQFRHVTGVDTTSSKFPPLMWLMNEDSVPLESFYKVCDKNFMLLKVKRLLQHMEKARGRLAGSLKLKSSSMPDLKRPPSRTGTGPQRGGRSTASSRLPSRGQLSREQLHQSIAQTQDELDQHFQKAVQKELLLQKKEKQRQEAAFQQLQEKMIQG
eukprot:TRINITY_DN96581_c0_g1_i1.p1 TRINITY_DN96581_c0_g1~~TRINITY_DN96581_c0_g1_i1.p1  ORF type:complete len:603 (-),score=156.62 TRINITY_DN96581_c0_g1_i1:64-1872(-)